MRMYHFCRVQLMQSETGLRGRYPFRFQALKDIYSADRTLACSCCIKDTQFIGVFFITRLTLV